MTIGNKTRKMPFYILGDNTKLCSIINKSKISGCLIPSIFNTIKIVDNVNRITNIADYILQSTIRCSSKILSINNRTES